QFNGSLAGLLAASTAEAAALVSGAARAGYDLSTLIAQAYATADDLAIRYLTSPPAPILAEAHERRRQLLLMLHDQIPPAMGRDLYLVAGLVSGISAYACLDLGHPDAARPRPRQAMSAPPTPATTGCGLGCAAPRA